MNKQTKVKKFQQKLKSFVKNENWNEALKIYDELIEVRETPQRWCNRSFVLFQLGKIGEALEGYDRALLLDPECEIAHQGIAKAEQLLREMDVEDEYEDLPSPTKENDKEKVLTQEFQKHAKAKNWAQALTVTRALIEIQPTMERLCNQGFLFVKHGALEKALNSYNKALQINPNSEIAKKSVQKVQNMIYEVREGTKEELAIHFQETGLPNSIKVMIGSVLVFVVIVAFVQSYSKNEKKTSNPEEKITQEQQTKELILIDGKWLTPQEKFAQEQQAKGLVLIDGKWLTSQEKFTQEQQAKGLVLINGKWLTPQEKFAQEQQAKGLVLINSKWLTPQEKFAQEQRAKGLIKWEGEWRSKDEIKKIKTSIEKKYPKQMQKYYEYLKKRCRKASSNKHFKKAYEYVQSSKSVEEFTGISVNVNFVKKARLKLKKQKTYIFPLELYKQRKNIEYIFAPEKVERLNNKIYKLNQKYRAIISNKKKLEKDFSVGDTELAQKKIEIQQIEKDINSVLKIKNDISSMLQQIKYKKEQVRSNEVNIAIAAKQISSLKHLLEKEKQEESNDKLLRSLEIELNNQKRERRDIENELRETERQIDSVERELRQAQNENDKTRLRNKLSNLESIRKTNKRNQDDIFRKVDELEKDILKEEHEAEALRRKLDNLESQIRELEKEQLAKNNSQRELGDEINSTERLILSKKNTLENAEKMLPSWKEKHVVQKSSLRKQLKTQKELRLSIDNHNQKLKPLTKLYQRKQDISKVVGKFQRWWSNLQANEKMFLKGKAPIKKPLFHMLLSLYVLTNFSSDFIKIKQDKSYRSLGASYIYFR